METNQLWAAVEELAGKIAVEIGYAEAGQDAGLLPVNALLGELEDLSHAEPVPEPLVVGLARAREVVDNVFNTGAFSAESIRTLRDWANWCQRSALVMKAEGEMVAFVAQEAGVGTRLGSEQRPSEEGAPAPLPEPNEREETAPVILLNIESDGDLLREFINESQEHLQNIELGVLTLEHTPTDRDTLNSIFRAFHTFKGGSGFLNLAPINHLAHELESLLDLARQEKLVITSAVIEVILAGADTLKQFVQEIHRQLTGEVQLYPIAIPIAHQVQTIRRVIENPKVETVAVVGVGALINSQTSAKEVLHNERSPSILGVEPGAGSTPLYDVVEAPAAPTMVSETARGGEAAAGGEVAGGKMGSLTSVKVDIHKLDSLVDLVGEMVISQTMLAQDRSLAGIESQSLARNLAQLSRNTKDLQRIAMSLRMVPVRASFQKMNRLVRDLAARQGKHVELVLSGEDTELDRTIVEEIGDPLVHMIRNSMDHGIETPEVRVSKGKSATGVIHLRAYHQGGNIVIQIQDDGAGLNRDRILKKAVEAGLVRENETLDEKEIYALIFAPGFSTAEKVTDISGRGVGMDVVKRNIDKLRGKIEIESVLGKGSTFSLHLPLTLAIIDGLIVVVGNERFVIPTLSVRESFRPKPDSIARVHDRGELVHVRGRYIPLLRLHEHFSVSPRSTDPYEGIVVVLESGMDTRCILVDQLVGKQEVVIKSLGGVFKENRALAGAAILGDGRVGLILDPNALVKLSPQRLCEAA